MLLISSILPLPLVAAEGGFGVLDGVLVGIIAVGGGLGWWLHQKKIAELQAAAEAAAAAAAHKAEAERQAAAATHAALVAEFDAHRTAAEAAQNQAVARIGSLEADLRQTQEVAALLPPAQLRIGDLEKALNSERGHLAAIEQTLATVTRRADDLEVKLRDTTERFEKHRDQASQRETELSRELAAREKEFTAGRVEVDEARAEAAKATETLSQLREQSEKRIATLQRNLSAAEARASLVQKEFMTAVGVTAEPAAPSKDNGSRDADRRARQLEDSLKQAEAEARKKAREDGYKIAELEFRLSEAQEAAAKAGEVETLRAEVERLKKQLGE
ncbi:MAG: hypothetical protein KDK97_01240 [Verrucomicrobiales bacterium]|nr:hypothetical protein [Verrucomicrobiales bacterium]